MHISDGVLTTPVWAGSYVVTLAIAAYTIKKVRQEELPKIAVLTSVFFVASLIHIPLGPASVHLILTGMVGVILGWAAFPSVLLGLILQALLFQHGGITSLGANACLMGIPALISSCIFHQRKHFNFKHNIAVFGAIAGGFATLFSGLILAIFLITAGEDFIGVAKYAALAHLPVMLVEGAVTAFTVNFLNKVKPELLDGIIVLHED